MLRPITNNHCQSYWQSFSFTSTTAPSASTTIGTGDVVSITRPSAGQVVPVLETPYSSPAITAVTPAAGALGYAGIIAAAQTNNTLVPGIHDSGGNFIDASYEVFSLGWRSLDRNGTRPQILLSSKEKERIIWCKVTAATGVITIGNSDFTCTRTALGNFTFTFKRAFGRTPVVQATPIFAAVSGNRLPRITAKSAGSCTVVFANRAGSADDPTSFYLIVSGVDSIEEDCRNFSQVFSSQRKPRIIGGRVTYSGGTPSITIGAGDFTIADTAVGQCTITLTKPFAREFAICGAVRTASRFNLEIPNTASVALIDTLGTASGALADPTSFDFIAIGSDDATEY